MEKIYIFGHRNPDTDSVTSAIALEYLKKSLGFYAEARVLGEINDETKFVLDKWNIKIPKYLNDVKLQLKDVNYHKGFYIKETDSIYNGYQYMLREGLTGLPVVKEDGTFKGLITIKDLSHILVNENIDDLYTSYDNLLEVLKAKEIFFASNRNARYYLNLSSVKIEISNR